MTAAPGNRPSNQTRTALVDGDDGLTSIADTDYIGDSGARNGFHAFDNCGEVGIVATPGNVAVAVISAGLAYCEAMKDRVYICAPNHSLTATAIMAFRKSASIGHSTFGAMYSSWIKVRDSLTGGYKLVPPDGDVFRIFGLTDRETEPWYAPAGISRGQIRDFVELDYNPSPGDQELLYENGVNPIITETDAGTYINGQMTLSLIASALDRINVRRLMIYVEKAIVASSKWIVFELNDPILWRQIKRAYDPFLRGIQSRRAFNTQDGRPGFMVKCDEEINTDDVIDRNELIVRVFIRPNKVAEFILIQFVLTTTGALFEEIYGTP
jgi:phage tail sheath protein FI